MKKEVILYSVVSIIILLLFIVQPLIASENHLRTAKRKKISGKGWVTLSNGIECHDKKEDIIEIIFPIMGGKITGKRAWKGHEAEEKHDPPRCREKDESQTIIGTFSGGDGGKIDGWVINDDPNRKRKYKLTGVVQSDGKAYIKWSKYHEKKPRELTFKPFCTQDTNIDVYSKKAYDVIQGKMLNLASAHAFKGFRAGVEEGWKYLVQQAHHMEMMRGTYVHRYYFVKVKRPPLPFIEELSLKFIPDRKKVATIPATSMLHSLFDNLGTAISLIEAADSALDGDYATAAFQTAVEAIGLYSNSLGLMLAVGQAVKADWDAFAKRHYAKEYRKFYEDLYYSGGKRPSMKVWKKSRKQRLKNFMEEVHEVITASGAGGETSWSTGNWRSKDFRSMLIDFASYRLKLDLGYDDFAMTEDRRGKLVFKNLYIKSVFVSLFNDFEKTYRNDAVAQFMRNIAIKQARLLQEKSLEATGKLFPAQDYRFDKVWKDEQDLEMAYCKAINEMKNQMKGKAIFK